MFCKLSYLFRTTVILSVGLGNGLFAQEKPVIGVLGLDNGGGITGAVIDTVCNRISYLIEKTDRYFVLQREFIPPVLEEQGFTVSEGICSRAEGLAAAGFLLSADEMIGGSIKRSEKGITLDLQRMQVHDRTLLAAYQIETALSRQDFLDLELPQVVGKLLESFRQPEKKEVSVVSDSSGGRKRPVDLKQRKKRGLLWTTLSAVFVSGAAAGAIVYYDRKHPEPPGVAAPPGPPDVPLGELPARVR